MPYLPAVIWRAIKIKLKTSIAIVAIAAFISAFPVFADDAPTFYGDEVVVTALRQPRLKSSVPWDTQVITRKEIENSAALKLGDILRSCSGIAVKSNGDLSSQISIRLRGSNSQQVLVLLNGNRINSPSLGSFDLGDILLTDVEKIEIVKAPLSAMYGADAVGGVINIVTRTTTPKHQLEALAGYGDFTTQQFSLVGSGPGYFFSAVSLYSGGFRTNSDYNANNFNLRFSHDLGKAKVEVGAKKYAAQKGSPGSLDFLTPNARQTDNNLFYDLSYNAQESGFKFSASQVQLDQNYRNPDSYPPVDTTHKTVTTNANLQKTIILGDNNIFSFGLEGRQDDSQSTNSGQHYQTNQALYLQEEIKTGENINWVLGAREDFNSAYGNHFNPRLGAVIHLWPDTNLKVSGGLSFRGPTMDDLYWGKLTETYTWGSTTYVSTTEGNPNLRPETAQNIDMTLEKQIGQFSTARLSAYVSEIQDMIRWTNTSSSTTQSYYTPLNISAASIQGAEFEYKSRWRERWQAFINMTYQLAKDKDSGKFLNYSPVNSYNAGLLYEDKEAISSNLLVKYVGERYADLNNTTTLAPYTVVVLTLVKELASWKAKLDIQNLFNTSYAESYGFSDVYPMPGRRYNVSVSVKI